METVISLEHRPVARLDPRRVRHAMGRAAWPTSDDLLTAIQQQLEERLAEIPMTPLRILELSRQPGALTKPLQARFPRARIISTALAAPPKAHTSGWRLPWKSRPLDIIGDLTRLPFAGQPFDLVIAHMVLHWSPDPLTTLREIRRLLKPGAPVLVTTLGADTLKELKTTLAEIDQIRHGRSWPRILEFPMLSEFGDLMQHAGLSQPVVDRDVWCPQFADLFSLLEEMHRMGATNPFRQRSNTLTGKGYFSAVQHLYRSRYAHGPDSPIPVSLEILYGHAWKKGSP
ncbi:MAG: methyltransferase domain-containing protein [Magnetococcales bacterium]|nr:methyltransferase domain-containing protein [Magnetococcales bacterium]NGZ04776.1 methyltransferase domain-containing protein [Magnetococcales bacterium]